MIGTFFLLGNPLHFCWVSGAELEMPLVVQLYISNLIRKSHGKSQKIFLDDTLKNTSLGSGSEDKTVIKQAYIYSCLEKETSKQMEHDVCLYSFTFYHVWIFLNFPKMQVESFRVPIVYHDWSDDPCRAGASARQPLTAALSQSGTSVSEKRWTFDTFLLKDMLFMTILDLTQI